MAKRKQKKDQKIEFNKKNTEQFVQILNGICETFRIKIDKLNVLVHYNAMGHSFFSQIFTSFPINSICYSAEDADKSIVLSGNWISGGLARYIAPKDYFEPEVVAKTGQKADWENVGKSKKEKKKFPDFYCSTSSIFCQSVRLIRVYNWGFEMVGDISSILVIEDEFFLNLDSVNELIEICNNSIKLDTAKLKFKTNPDAKNKKIFEEYFSETPIACWVDTGVYYEGDSKDQAIMSGQDIEDDNHFDDIFGDIDFDEKDNEKISDQKTKSSKIGRLSIGQNKMHGIIID